MLGAEDTLINGRITDERGVFWIGSNQGLSSYNPDTRQNNHVPTSGFW